MEMALRGKRRWGMSKRWSLEKKEVEYKMEEGGGVGDK